MIMLIPSETEVLNIRFVIAVVFLNKTDRSVCTCLTQLYECRDMYRIYYIKNNYRFRQFAHLLVENPHKSSIAAY